MKKLLLLGIVGLLFVSCVTYTPNHNRRHYNTTVVGRNKHHSPNVRHRSSSNNPSYINSTVTSPAAKPGNTSPAQPPSTGAASKPDNKQPTQTGRPSTVSASRSDNYRPVQASSPNSARPAQSNNSRPSAVSRPADDPFEFVKTPASSNSSSNSSRQSRGR